MATLNELKEQGLPKGQLIHHITTYQWDGEKAVCLVSDDYATKGDILPMNWDAEITTAYDSAIDIKELLMPEPFVVGGYAHVRTCRSTYCISKNHYYVKVIEITELNLITNLGIFDKVDCQPCLFYLQN